MLAPPAFILGPGLLAVAGISVLGVILYRAFGGSARDDPARAIARATLVLIVLAAAMGAATGVGFVAAIGGGPAIAVISIFAGLGLIGAGLLGGPRWLILPVIVLVLPLAVVSAADLDLRGGVGERKDRPVSVADLRPEYRIGVGHIDLDLRDMRPSSTPTEVNLRVGIGEARVRVPLGACVVTRGKIGVGAADLPERVDEGVDISLHDGAAPTAPDTARHVHDQCRHRRRAPADRRRHREGLRVRRGRADRTLIVAGLAAIALGTLLLLDRTGTIDVRFDYMLPAVLAAAGAVLVVAGLSQ